MPGDSHPLPDRGRRGSPRGRTPSNNTRRPSNLPHSLPYPPPGPQSPSEAVQPTIIASSTSPYHPSPSGYPPPLVPFPSQRHSYFGHYNMPPTTMRMGPTPSFPFPFPQPENTLLPQPIHAGYPSMMQHHPQAMYSYQRGSPEGIPSHPSYPTAGPSQLYQLDPSRAAHSPMSPQGTNTPPSYTGPSQFHSLQYAHHTTPPYTYPSQSFPSTPTHYQSPYPSPPYAQPYSTSSPEHEHGTWWYVPSQPQSAGHPQYSRPYAVPFTPRPDTEPSYGPTNASAPSSSTTGITYQTPPSQPLLPSDSRVPSPTRSPDASDRPPPPSTPSNPRQSPPPNSRLDRPAVRRPYHPNPPAHRSEWVMWAGNVPSDASHDEAWRFFTSIPEDSPPDHPPRNGVVSIFLISRSCCVFVNFDSSDTLKAGIERFNGSPLRPHEPRCPRLVCRERGKGDDLKAGVGGQRGSGMHMRWLREQKAKGQERITSYSSDEPPTSPRYSDLSRASISSDDDPRASRPTKQSQSSRSGSFASTTSSLLVRHFPQRYFILKSLTQFDLDLSVEKGLWATQKHNEDILDQAFRTSKEVFLIFGVNKSGEFYGYARMAGPLRNGEQDVSWASRTDSSSSSRSAVGLQQEVIVEESASPSYTADKPFFSPGEGRLVDKSPGAFSPDAHIQRDSKSASAPPITGHHHRLSLSPLSDKRSLDPGTSRQIYTSQAREFRLDADAPLRAVRGDSGHEDESFVKLGSVVEMEEGAETPAAGAERDPMWGDAFKVEWLCTERLPFHRTRQLRNPWNHGKEIKVSRDGTELEPGVGRQLLEEWALYVKEIASGEILAEPAKPRPMGPSKTAPVVPTMRFKGEP